MSVRMSLSEITNEAFMNSMSDPVLKNLFS